MGRSDSEYVASWGPFRIETAGVIFQGEIPVSGTAQVAAALALFFRRCGLVTTREQLKRLFGEKVDLAANMGLSQEMLTH